MDKEMRVYLPQIDEIVVFTKAHDGWWECKQWGRAINPHLSVCIMDPYYDIMGTGSPKFEFEIVEEI